MGWLGVLVVVASAAAAACSGADDPSVLTGRRSGAGGTDPNAPGDATDPASPAGPTDPSAPQTPTTSPPPAGSDGGTTPPPTSLTCTSCHGDATRVGIAGADANVKVAPPKAATTRAVGAHQAHLNKGTFGKPIACSECHVLPTATNHSNGTVEMTFGTLAKTGGKTPAWNGTSCSASYCHGNFTGGNVAAAPAWTGGAMTCTSCHGAPPNTGDHQRGAHQFACSNCHGTGYSSTTVNKATHLNGVKNAGGAGSSINNYNPATRACSPTCHGTETW